MFDSYDDLVMFKYNAETEIQIKEPDTYTGPDLLPQISKVFLFIIGSGIYIWPDFQFLKYLKSRKFGYKCHHARLG